MSNLDAFRDYGNSNFGIQVSPTSVGDEYKYGDLKEQGILTKSETCWSVHQNGSFMASPPTRGNLPPAVYTAFDSDTGIVFQVKELAVDELIEFPDAQTGEILQNINNFWNSKANFERYNILHRRGFLFYGPPGSGKTCLVHQIMRQIISRGGIVLYAVSPNLVARCLKQVRSIEPDRPIVCVFEDLDALINHFGEQQILSILDGEDQVGNVLNIATTNYPERLDRRVVGRPRRFDQVIQIGMPSAEVRSLYFSKKLKLPVEDIEEWVALTPNFSFAALTELLISVKCLGNPLQESVEKIKSLLGGRPSSADEEEELSANPAETVILPTIPFVDVAEESLVYPGGTFTLVAVEQENTKL